MKLYQGVRTPEGCQVTVTSRRKVKELNPALFLRNHSPAGFDWGYRGSGPAQLALALLYDAFEQNEELALPWYQDFKEEFVSQFDGPTWSLKDSHIVEWLCRKCCETIVSGDWRSPEDQQ